MGGTIGYPLEKAWPQDGKHAMGMGQGSGETSIKNTAIESFLSSKGNCSFVVKENDLTELHLLKSLSEEGDL